MPATNKLSWFSMSADAGVGTIKIYGDIGGWGVTFQDFNRQLENLGLGSGDTINLPVTVTVGGSTITSESTCPAAGLPR